MKKLGKILANVLIVTYAVIAIVVTILLLSYNEYHCSVIGGYTFILVKDDELEEHGFDKGSLVLVKETKAKNIKEGDYVFLYRYISASQFEIKYAQVLAKDSSGGEYKTQYILDGNTIVDHEDVIGSTEDMKVVPHLGTILSILQSRYGYLFLIVVVSFIAFLYEIYELIMEIKYGEREDDEDYYDEEDDDEYEDDGEYEYEDEDEDEEEEIVRPKKKATTTRKATTAKSRTSTAKKATSSKASTKTTTTRKSTTAKASTNRTKKATTSASATKKATSTKGSTATNTANTKASTSGTKKATTKASTAKKQ